MRARSGYCSSEMCKGKGETLLANVNRKLCFYCNRARLMQGKPKKKFPTYKHREASGELELFKKLALVRPPICAVCGTHIYTIRVHNMAHVLSKKSFPRFRLAEVNILVMCWTIDGDGCHNRFDAKAKSDLMKDEKWHWVFNLADSLKQQYNTSKN